MIKQNQFQGPYSNVSSTEIRNINLFWVGFSIYSLVYAFSQTYDTNVHTTLFQAFEGFGLMLMVVSAMSLIRFKITNQYLKIIYTLYCIWLVIIIFRDIYYLLNYSHLKSFFLNGWYGGLLYFTPLILLFPNNSNFHKKTFDIIILFGFIYIVFDILFIKYLLNPDVSDVKSKAMVENFSLLSFSSGFILLTYSYHSRRRQFFAFFVTLLALLFAIIRARRGMVFMYTSIFLFSYILYVSHAKSRIIIIFLTIVLFMLGIFYAREEDIPFNNRIFGGLIERGTEDTRSQVEGYFYADMKTKDWIVGRGINGEYFAPDIEEGQITNYRNTIETGYLQTILNGGIISIGLFLFIAIPAIIKGIFYSKNTFSKAAAIWILMSIIDSYPSTVNTFSLSYLLVWVFIAVCYSKEIRNISENSIKKYFQS